MIVLDENIIASQRAQLRNWRIHFSHIGTDIGRKGMQDLGDIVPLLHRLNRSTFFTCDSDFFDAFLCHRNYALICLDVSPKETAGYVRSVLRHPVFGTQRGRLGKVILARPKDLIYWEVEKSKQQRVNWP